MYGIHAIAGVDFCFHSRVVQPPRNFVSNVPPDAGKSLPGVYERFGEGHQFPDLAAKELLDKLQQLEAFAKRS